MFNVIIGFIFVLLVIWGYAVFAVNESESEIHDYQGITEELPKKEITKNKWLYPEEHRVSMYAGRAMDEEETIAHTIPEKLAHHGDFQIIDKS